MPRGAIHVGGGRGIITDPTEAIAQQTSREAALREVEESRVRRGAAGADPWTSGGAREIQQWGGRGVMVGTAQDIPKFEATYTTEGGERRAIMRTMETTRARLGPGRYRTRVTHGMEHVPFKLYEPHWGPTDPIKGGPTPEIERLTADFPKIGQRGTTMGAWFQGLGNQWAVAQNVATATGVPAGMVRGMMGDIARHRFSRVDRRVLEAYQKMGAPIPQSAIETARRGVPTTYPTREIESTAWRMGAIEKPGLAGGVASTFSSEDINRALETARMATEREWRSGAPWQPHISEEAWAKGFGLPTGQTRGAYAGAHEGWGEPAIESGGYEAEILKKAAARRGTMQYRMMTPEQMARAGRTMGVSQARIRNMEEYAEGEKPWATQPMVAGRGAGGGGGGAAGG